MILKIRRGRALMAALIVLQAMVMAMSGRVTAADKVLDGPSDDRWHYPFNFSGGAESRAAVFTAGGDPDFDYRDGVAIFRFKPETANQSDPEYIRPGMCPDCYLFTGAQVVVWHDATAAYTWDTNGNTTDSVGNPFRLQIFGMGNNDALTLTHPTQPFTLETWTQSKPYFGRNDSPPPYVERSPYPLNIDALASPQNVSNLTSAMPWGLGQPIYGSAAGEYTPGVMPAAPFPVTFTLDITNPRVRAYIQESLSQGRIDWVVTATALGTAPKFPRFIMKENILNKPAQLILKDFNYAPSRTVTLDGPSDDRYHYPHIPDGTGIVAAPFTSTPSGSSDYRESVNLLRFKPNTVNPLDPEYIPSGLPPEDYHVAKVTVTVWSPTNVGGNPFLWDTRDTITTDSLGNTQNIQLFGMGNHDSVTSPSFTLDTWHENRPFFGAFLGSERNPFPLNLDALSTDTVANNGAALPWALGHPVYGTGAGEYTPGTIATEPFPITFTLDMENARVRDYVQDSLSQGRLDWVISATFSATLPGARRPRIIQKEDIVLNKPPRVVIEFCDPPPNAVGVWNEYE